MINTDWVSATSFSPARVGKLNGCVIVRTTMILSSFGLEPASERMIYLKYRGAAISWCLLRSCSVPVIGRAPSLRTALVLDVLELMLNQR